MKFRDVLLNATALRHWRAPAESIAMLIRLQQIASRCPPSVSGMRLCQRLCALMEVDALKEFGKPYIGHATPGALMFYWPRG